jgi:hypothetical protein
MVQAAWTKNNQSKRAGSGVHVVEHPLNKCESLSSNPSTAKEMRIKNEVKISKGSLKRKVYSHECVY